MIEGNSGSSYDYGLSASQNIGYVTRVTFSGGSWSFYITYSTNMKFTEAGSPVSTSGFDVATSNCPYDYQSYFYYDATLPNPGTVLPHC